MIVFCVQLTPDSMIAVAELTRHAVAGVLEVLGTRGVHAEDVEPPAFLLGRHSRRRFRLVPGPATMTVSTDDGDDGSVQIILRGPGFGRRFGVGEQDPVVWMQLVVFGLWLAETYRVAAVVTDPDHGG
ncbi:hypothetical protein [Mycolicibacterium fortuitum]|uniref:hypothetical protein n=1 Tax=Mycolicibacterium fortuitum TaxID=1766 RepID=UPI001CDD363F|nr:hypothetical protein [Mycolicibacterium fortuitum]UBV18085.1 hypothetical protein H8Z57_15600 [Mycolicibacterium fortuitum]